MTRVLLVDWLGRGGIAQCSAEWITELRRGGADVRVVTRAGRELAAAHGEYAVVAGAHGNPLLAHRAVVRAAVQTLHEWRPDVVVVQNYVVPPLELALHRAVARSGAHGVTVVHDHQLHSRLAGTGVGLRSIIRGSTTVVAHSEFVASRLRHAAGRDVQVVMHPVQTAMVGAAPLPRTADAAPLAVHFGVVKRRYKGTGTVLQLAAGGVPGWRFAVMGNGAPAAAPGVECFPGFVDSATLVERLRGARAALLPYSMATQSGSVVLAQALGVVPVATAVGGIPEQIEDGVTGRLLPPDAGVDAWHRVLAELSDDGVAASLGAEAQRRAWERHAHFVASVRALCGVVASPHLAAVS